MPFSVGIVELGLIACAVAVTVAAVVSKSRSWRWGAAACGCLTLAALLTPADPLSQLLVATAMLAAYAAGTLHYQLLPAQADRE